ncbi:MAG: hypothetical protein KAI43_04030 [Candidatus Aureabacteria bacterium]|nr:hypothetical protein [Candidatus Auribacterota bacterium]
MKDAKREINWLSSQIQFYSGYFTSEDRKTSLDVFKSNLIGKISRWKKLFEETQRSWVEQGINLDKMMFVSDVLKEMEDVLDIKDIDTELKKLFFNESILYESELHGNMLQMDIYLVRLDDFLLKHIKKASYAIEEIDHFNESKYEESVKMLRRIKLLVSEKKSSIEAYSRKLKELNGNILKFENDVSSINCSKSTESLINLIFKFSSMRYESYLELIRYCNNNLDHYFEEREDIDLYKHYSNIKSFIEIYFILQETVNNFINTNKQLEIYKKDKLKTYFINKNEIDKKMNILQKKYDEVKIKVGQMQKKRELMDKAGDNYRDGLKKERQMQFDEAFKSYNIALSIDPQMQDAKRQIKVVKNKQKYYPKYLKAVELKQHGNIEKAEKIYQKIIKKCPEYRDYETYFQSIKPNIAHSLS